MVTTETVRELANRRCSSWEIKRAAVADGMISLRHDGWRKVMAGMTSVDEVLQNTKSDEIGGAGKSRAKAS